MRIYFLFLFLLVLLPAGCAPRQKQISKHKPPTFLYPLPAVFQADVPLKKYPSASFELVLRPGGMYFLQMKRKAPDNAPVQAEVGLWRYNRKQKTLRLTGYDKAVRLFRLTGKRSLKPVKVSGGMMPSGIRYKFILTDKPPRYEGVVRMQGMYSRKRGRGVFQECLSRERFPLLSQGTADIKKAYQNLLHGRSESLFVIQDVRISSRAGRGDRLVPVRSHAVKINPYRSCKGKQRQIATITDKRWYLIQLEGKVPKAEQMKNKTLPFLKLQRGEQLIEGFAGCNNFIGSWLFADNNFMLNRIKATRMACPVGMAVEDAFLRALDNTRGYTVRGNILSLHDQRSRVLARLRYSRNLNDLDFRYLSSGSEDAEAGAVLSEETVVPGGAIPSSVTVGIAETSKKKRSTPSDSATLHTRRKKITILKPRKKKIVVNRTAQTETQHSIIDDSANSFLKSSELQEEKEERKEDIPLNSEKRDKLTGQDITLQDTSEVVENGKSIPEAKNDEQKIQPEPAVSENKEIGAASESEESPADDLSRLNSQDDKAKDMSIEDGAPFPASLPSLTSENKEEIQARPSTPESQKKNQIYPQVPQGPSSCNRPWKIPLAEISGQITQVEMKAPPWTKQRGLHLEVENSSGTSYVIHVFPEKLMEQCRELFNFKAGEKVAVSGSEFRTGESQQNICAATITRGSDLLRLRDPVTSTLENQLCCLSLCEKKCGNTPQPEMCRKRCSSRCRNTMRAQ